MQQCQQLRITAPMVELWESLYEHGMEASTAAGQTAVQVAVTLRDASAAATLLVLTCQYSSKPLAEAEAAAVLRLLEAGESGDMRPGTT